MIIHPPKSKRFKPKNVPTYDEMFFKSSAPVITKKSEKKRYVEKSTPSKGESVIIDWLKKHNVKFVPEKKFADLINPDTKQQLRMDFYLPELNTCIEFDGKQHFETVKKFDRSKMCFINRQIRDIIKNEYCEKKGIKMVRIKYDQIKKIHKILCAVCLKNKHKCFDN